MADTLSCQWETLHSQQLRSIKKSIDSDHGIYRDRRRFIIAHSANAGGLISFERWASDHSVTEMLH